MDLLIKRCRSRHPEVLNDPPDITFGEDKGGREDLEFKEILHAKHSE